MPVQKSAGIDIASSLLMHGIKKVFRSYNEQAIRIRTAETGEPAI
jgi:hypothetical protein